MSGDPILVEEYNNCVEKLKEFRNVHLQVVTRLVLLVTVLDAFGLMWVFFKVEGEKKISYLSVNS